LFATGVAVITAETLEGRIGATVSSFNSVSLDPPLVLFSLSREARGIAQWRAAEHLGIIVLPERHKDVSNRFARSGGDKWADLPVACMTNGAPLLPGWLAYFECEPYAIYDGGDHDIFVCRVSRFEARPSGDRPLIFFGGRYAALTDDTDRGSPAELGCAFYGW
jgi:flavin reductase (DIM6/NTAB) family NADH-FMN oxidoreductase RutF